MGSIAGDLDVMSLPDVVIWLANRQRSGRLTIQRGGVTKQLYIVNGAVTQSSSDDPRERLGQHLVNYGYVSEQQLQVAFQTQVETGVPLGRVLVMSGVLDDERLMRVLNFKTRECLLDAFEWEQGTFEFNAQETRDPELDAPTPTLLAEIHSEGVSRHTMWEEIRKVLPGPQTQLDVKEPIPSGLNNFDRRILEYAAAGRSIGEVALEVRALDFHVFARLYDLAGRGLVKARPPGAPRTVPSPVVTTPSQPAAVVPAAREELLMQLRQRLQAGQHDDAYLLAQRVLERDPNNVEALNALRAAQAAAHRPGAPSRTLTPAAVPQLTVTREHLDEYLLTSKERYVLSRIDGKRSLQQIMQVSPIQEAELLRIVEAFVQRGFIRV
ncbi:MAG: DUF4388 domain-containing protein [Myxococcota bacterium]